MNFFKKFKPITYCLLVLVGLSIAGCDGFLDVNKDPNAATDPPGDTQFTEASLVLQSNRDIEVGEYTSFFIQTFASNASNGGSLFLPGERYNIAPGSFTVTNNFGGIYTNVLNNLKLYLQDQKKKTPKRNNAIAQAQLLRSYTFWYLTMLFGPVPYTQANNLDFPNPKFTPQQVILDSLVTNINQSISLINTDDQSDAIQTEDVWYNGNMQRWLDFANSFKLRILMQQYNTDPSVASKIQNLLDSPDLIRDPADNFDFPYADQPGNENQQFQLHDDYAGGQPAFFYAGKQLVDLMNADNDPRRQILFNKNSDGKYVGVPPGDIVRPTTDVSTLGSAITSADFPGRVLDAQETLFFESEFLATQGNYSQARSKLEAGIRASVEGLSNDVDPQYAVSQAQEDAYVQNILGDYDAASNAGKLKEIQIQHYIDSFEKCPENWANWRRTHVPDLQLPAQAALSNIIRRLPYSLDEVSANSNAPEQPSLDKPMSYEK